MEKSQSEMSNEDNQQRELSQRQTQLRKFRLLLIVIYVIGAAILTPLFLIRMNTCVEIYLEVSRMSFVLGENNSSDLFSSFKMNSLSLTNFEEINLGSGNLQIAAVSDPDNGIPINWQNISLASSTSILPDDDFASVSMEDVTLNQLNINPSSVITVSSFEKQPGYLSLVIDEMQSSGRIAVNKEFRFSCDYCRVSNLSNSYSFDSKILRFQDEREHVINFWGLNESIALHFEVPSEANIAEKNISIKDGVDFITHRDGRLESTVLGNNGKIVFKELNDKTVEISSGDFVILDNLKDFSVRSLQVSDRIDVVLHGSVGKLAIGTENHLKDQRPRILEWIKAREVWTLYLGALVAFGATVLAILERLRII